MAKNYPGNYFFENLSFQNGRQDKANFSISPILKIFSRKFLGLVLGLVGSIDAKELIWLNLYSCGAVWHKASDGQKTLKMYFLPVLELMSDSLTTI